MALAYLRCLPKSTRSRRKNKTYQFKVHQSSINCNSLGTIFYSTPSRIHRTFSLSKNVVPNTFMVYQFLLWFIIFITIKVNIVEGILRYILFSEPPIYTSRLQQMTLSQATEPTVTRTKPSPGPQETKLRISVS